MNEYDKNPKRFFSASNGDKFHNIINTIDKRGLRLEVERERLWRNNPPKKPVLDAGELYDKQVRDLELFLIARAIQEFITKHYQSYNHKNPCAYVSIDVDFLMIAKDSIETGCSENPQLRPSKHHLIADVAELSKLAWDYLKEDILSTQGDGSVFWRYVRCLITGLVDFAEVTENKLAIYHSSGKIAYSEYCQAKQVTEVEVVMIVNHDVWKFGYKGRRIKLSEKTLTLNDTEFPQLDEVQRELHGVLSVLANSMAEIAFSDLHSKLRDGTRYRFEALRNKIKDGVL